MDYKLKFTVRDCRVIEGVQGTWGAGMRDKTLHTNAKASTNKLERPATSQENGMQRLVVGWPSFCLHTFNMICMCLAKTTR